MKFIRHSVQKRPTLFKRLNAPYRVVFIDDSSLEEVASFNLTKSKIYMLFSTLFVITVALTVLILLFSPLKYYIPGYGNDRAYSEVIRLRRNVDSLSDLVTAQKAYTDNIRKVIVGDFAGVTDTALLDIRQINQQPSASLLPPPQVLKQQALESVKKENNSKLRRR